MPGSEERGLPANILVDRLLHASDASDAQSSLESLLKSIPENAESALKVITESRDCLQALSQLIVQSSLPSGIDLEEGQVIALEVLLSLLKHANSPHSAAKTLLLDPIQLSSNKADANLETSPLLHSLLDCLCSSDPQNTSPYPRILSLEIITETHKLSPTLTQENILSAPEGFHRLISLLNNNPQQPEFQTPESIRNATLLLLTRLSQNSGVVRKLLLFSEGYERVLGIAVNSDVNIEKAVVLDAIALCQNLLVEDAASDNGGCELFFGGGGRDQINVGGCVRLLDARFFKEVKTLDLRTPIPNDDDLDDLLSSPSSSSKQQQTFRVPNMTKEEEEVCHAVLDLFLFAIEVGETNEKPNLTKQGVASKLLHNHAVMGALLSLALYSPFMETQVPFYASVPTTSVQCHALSILSRIIPASTSSLLSSSTKPSPTIEEHGEAPSLQNIYPLYEYYAGEAAQPPLERLISLCYQKTTSLVSSHSRSVLRQTLTTEQANLLILHSLAPPPPDFDGDPSEYQGPSKDPVVKEMIQFLSKKDNSEETKKCILYTVGILLINGGDTAKELLLRFPMGGKGLDEDSPAFLLDYLYESLDNDLNSLTNSNLNLLCAWSYSTPSSSMETILHFPQTLALSCMLEKNEPFAAILLGLWLCYFSSIEESSLSDSKDKDISGWSKETIVQLIQRFGISKYSKMLDSFVDNGNKIGNNDSKINNMCTQERKEEAHIHFKMVTDIRKSLVSSITYSSSSESREMAEMSQLLEKYQTDLSNLQSKFAQQEDLAAKQASEIKNFKLKFQPVTPLDEALAEQVDRTASAEERVEKLEKELKIQLDLVTDLKREKADLKKEVEAEKQDNADREEELTALSSAYNTLETEYRKVYGSNDANFESGQNDAKVTPLDVATMKNELEALRSQIQAGDEWMAMAVDRMNNMAAENEALQKQVSDQFNTSTSEQTEINNLNKEIQALASDLESFRVKEKELENENQKSHVEINKLNKEIESLSATLDEMQGKDENHERDNQEQINRQNEEIQRLTNDLKYLKAEKEKLKCDYSLKIETMQQELTNLAQDLDAERLRNVEDTKTFSSSVETSAVQRLEVKVEHLLKEIEDKENVIASKDKQTTFDLAAVRKECKDTILKKENEALKLRNELDNQLQRNGVVMEQKESEIVLLREEIEQLKTKQTVASKDLRASTANDYFSTESAPSQPMSVEEQESLRTELMQLREANIQAQEWMSNAYEHQEKISHDIELLREENFTLKNEVEALQNSTSLQSPNLESDFADSNLGEEKIDLLKKDNELLKSTISVLEESKASIVKESENLKYKLEAVEKTRDELKVKVSGMMSDADELSRSLVEIESLKANISDLQNEMETLKNEIEVKNSAEKDREIPDKTAMDQLDQLQSTCQSLQKKFDQVNDENNELLIKQTNYAEAMDQLKSRLSEYQTWTKTAQDRISELEEEREIADRKCDDMKQLELQHEQKINDLTSNVKILESKLSDTENVLQKNSAEILQTREKLARSEVEMNLVSKSLQVTEKEKNNAMDKMESTYDELKKLLIDVTENALELNHASNGEIMRLFHDHTRSNCDALKKSEDEINEYKEKIKLINEENILSINKWRDEVNSLQATVTDLQTQLEQSNQNAKDDLTRLEANCARMSVQLEESEKISIQNKELAQKVRFVEEELEKANALIASSSELQAKCVNLNALINELKIELSQKDETIAICEDQAAGYLNRLEEDRKTTEDALNQWKYTADELENTVNILNQQLSENEKQIEEQKMEAEEAITHWEKRCSALEEQIDEQEKQLDEAEERIVTQQEEIQDLKHTELKMRSMQETSKSQIVALTKELEYNNAKSEEERKVLIAEIETKVEHSMSLEMELDGAQTSRDDIITKIKEYKDLLTLEQQARISTEESLRGERYRVSQLESSLQSETKSKIQIQRDFDKHKVEENSLKVKLSKSKALNKSNEQKLKKVENELAKSQLNIGHLQGELQEVTEALSSRNTDNASLKATEMATHALRKQVAEIQEQLGNNQKEMIQERETRIHVEEELEKLKADLALLTQAGDKIGADGQIRKLASKAADEIFRKERRELEELRSMLERTKDELRAAKAAEKKSEEQAANLRMHSSMCEQEVITTKNDVLFLNETIKELRDSEANNLRALQARIQDLELHRENTAHAHLGELETLKGELSQLNGEKDRLLHVLHESEKTNAALVVTETMSKDKGHTNDSNGVEAELARLKIANAQLLAAAADTGSKTEKRIRTAIAAHAASCEAELLLERDLRETAEKSCEDMQLQLNELRAKMKNGKTKESISAAKEILNKKKNEESLENELNSLRDELLTLSLDCKKGEEKNESLEKEIKEAQSTIRSLREKCEQLSSQSREVDRDVTFEASVASEIVQLRTESSQTNGGETSTSLAMIEQNGEAGRVMNKMSADEMYDLVHELKEAVKQERNLYRDLLTDHEELLAVLAEQDIEIDGLRSSLENLGGEEALNEALRHVEVSLEEKVKVHAMSN